MTESADILLRRIEAIDTAAADNRLRAESFRRMAEGLRDVVGTATSDDGVVTVVAGSDGAVKSIAFGPAVRTTDPAALSLPLMRFAVMTPPATSATKATQSATIAGTEMRRRGGGGGCPCPVWAYNCWEGGPKPPDGGP